MLRRTAAVVLADGTLTQFEDAESEVSRLLAGRPMAWWTLDNIMQVPGIVRTVLVTRADDRSRAEALRRDLPGLDLDVITAATSRQDSIHGALKHLAHDIESGSVDLVLVHDAARPLCRPDLMARGIAIADEVGGAVPVVDGDDLMEVRPDGTLVTLEPGHRYMRIQTPQAFRARGILQGYDAAAEAAFEDEEAYVSVQKFSDLKIEFFPGERRNIRVASAEDLIEATVLLDVRRDATS